MLSLVDQMRLEVSGRTAPEKKSELGQFLTPANTASFMAGLFPASEGVCRLLDAGAGVGSLSSAFLDRCITSDLKFKQIRLTACEIDRSIHAELRRSLSNYYEFKNDCSLSREISEQAQAEIVKALDLHANVLLSKRQRFLNSLFAKARKISDEAG